MRMESLDKMFTYRKLTTVCCAAVLALGLAACGTSDDDTQMGNGNGNGEPPPLTLLEKAIELAGRLDDVDVKTSLESAIENAGKLTSEAVNGDSAMATTNAEMVLTAETAINDAVTNAGKVLVEVEMLRMEAEDLEDGSEKEAVLRLLDDAIKAANELVTEAQAIIDGITTSGDDE